MSKIYRYNRRAVKRRHFVLAILFALLIVVGPAGYFIYRDLQSNGQASIQGESRTVGQIVGSDSENRVNINEETFKMTLPSDWKLLRKISNESEKSITWQATKKGEDARTLKVYVDTIPVSMPVNRLMPVMVQGDRMIAEEVSDNCATFTGGGSLDTRKASTQQPTKAKWQGVDFICNLPNVVENEVGAGTVGGKINSVTVTGLARGSHEYFFLYTDHTIQPNYAIFSDALESFMAK